MRALALAGLVLLGACNRPQADQPTPGADGEAQARTAAKTIADLQAADAASQGPAPEIAPARAPRPVKARLARAEATETDADTEETNTQ